MTASWVRGVPLTAMLGAAGVIALFRRGRSLPVRPAYRAELVLHASQNLDQVLSTFVSNPELRPFFYDDRQPPDDHRAGARIDATAERLLEALDAAIAVTSGRSALAAPAAGHVAYATRLAQSSPAVRRLLRRYPERWPSVRQGLQCGRERRRPGSVRRATALGRSGSRRRRP
jgi:hypothetical protein